VRAFREGLLSVALYTRPLLFREHHLLAGFSRTGVGRALCREKSEKGFCMIWFVFATPLLVKRRRHVMPDSVVREDSPHAGPATRDLARTRAPRVPAITAGLVPATHSMLGLPVRRRTGYPGQARSLVISHPTKAGAVCTRARPPGRRALLLQLAVAALCVVRAGATLTGFSISPPPPAARMEPCQGVLTVRVLAERFTSISSLAGYAGSASSLTVTGSGFVRGASYACKFTSLDSPSRVMQASAAFVTDSTLTCSWDAWPFPAGAAGVSMVAGAEPIPTNGPGPYFFNFIASWGGFQPAVGSALGTVVTVLGAGFAPGSSSFQCKLACSADGQQYNASVSAVVDSSSLMRCATSAWPGPACAASLSVWKGLQKVHGSAGAFQWSSGWAAIDPETAPSSGGAVLEVTGAGFNSTRQYRCIFSAAPLRIVRRTPATAVAGHSSTRLQCATPLWPSPEGVTNEQIEGQFLDRAIFQVEEDGQIVQYAQGTLDNSVAFQFLWHVWWGHSPTQHYIGQEPNISFVGMGFNPSRKDYTVKFQTQQSSEGGITISKVSPCVAVYQTTIICEAPYWGHAGATTSVQLYADQVLISSSGPALHTFRSNWVQVFPAFGPVSGGDVLTLSGHGFDTNRGDYVCKFYGTYGNSPVVEVATGLAYSSQQMTCKAPAWHHSEQFTNVVLELPTGGVVDFVRAAEGAQYEFRAYWTTLDTRKVLRAALRFTLPGSGGSVITFSGAGFRAWPIATYAIVLTCAEDHCADARTSYACSAGAGTNVFCQMPPWRRHSKMAAWTSRFL
jgi:hypothetical protein